MNVPSFVRSRMLAVTAAWVILSGLISPAANARDVGEYEAEQFDVSFQWDTDIWGNSSSSSSVGHERMRISSGSTSFFIEAYLSDGDIPVDCIKAARRSIVRAEGVEQFDDTTTLELPALAEGHETLLATYELVPAGRGHPIQLAQVVLCTSIGDDGMLLIGAETRLGIYDEELDIINDLLESFVIDGETLKESAG